MSGVYVFASFSGTPVKKEKIKGFTFTENVLNSINEEISKQLATVTAFKPVEFDGRYKSEPKEILYIDNYSDGDEVFECIEEALAGENPSFIKETEELREALGLFFILKSDPDKIIFQKFSHRMLIDKKNAFLKITNSDVYDYLPESTFTLANSIAGYYEISSKRLYIRSAFIGRQIFPAFSDEYVPGASAAEIKDFLNNPLFDTSSVRCFNTDSQKLARLVWLIRNGHIELLDRMEDLKDISSALNLRCITDDGHVRFFEDLEKTKLVLQIILKDVYRQGDEIFLSNSKRALTPFID